VPKSALEEPHDHPPEPRTPEEALDGWLAAAQVAAVSGEEGAVNLIAATAPGVVAFARRVGDPIRAARAAALYFLNLSESSVNLPVLALDFQLDFAEAQRVGDGAAIAFRELALGRWLVGIGGREYSALAPDATTDRANRALAALTAADVLLERQGMDPWLVYSWVQQVRALADLERFDDAQIRLDLAGRGLERFPIWTSHAHEAAGQVLAMQGEASEAQQSFTAALDAAASSGLQGRASRIEAYLRARQTAEDAASATDPQ